MVGAARFRAGRCFIKTLAAVAHAGINSLQVRALGALMDCRTAAMSLMALDALGFIRRFSMHILPKGLVRIRHYGILGSTCKKETIPRIKDQFPEQMLGRTECPKGEVYNPKICPHCQTETMVSLEILPKERKMSVKFPY